MTQKYKPFSFWGLASLELVGTAASLFSAFSSPSTLPDSQSCSSVRLYVGVSSTIFQQRSNCCGSEWSVSAKYISNPFVYVIEKEYLAFGESSSVDILEWLL